MKHSRYLEPSNQLQSVGGIGGSVYLPAGTPYPNCRHCGKPLLHFFWVRLPPELGFAPGSVLSVFMCSQHNEIPSFDFGPVLKGDYWDSAEGHWCAFLIPGGAQATDSPHQILVPTELCLEEAPRNAHYCFRIGGDPDWLQDKEAFTCSCGSPMRFIGQLSDSYKFSKRPEAESQPDSAYEDGYVLFLGNEVYVFACPAQCHSRSVWFAVQN